MQKPGTGIEQEWILDSYLYEIQGGLKYQTLEYPAHWNSTHFQVLFSNGPKTKWPLFCSVYQWSGPLENKLLASLDHLIYQHRFCYYINGQGLPNAVF